MLKPIPLLQEWIHQLVDGIEKQVPLNFENEPQFYNNEALITALINWISALPDDIDTQKPADYEAAIIAFEISVMQLKVAYDALNKRALKSLDYFMTCLSKAMLLQHHPLSFWLPFLNAFYDTQLELSPELTNAYLTLVEQEEVKEDYSEADHLHAIAEVIHDLSDLSVFQMADHFFSQAHAMASDFFVDLLIDLLQVPEGIDIAILFLLHPKAEVRKEILPIVDQFMPDLTLSQTSLSRLKSISAWYPPETQAHFEKWMKIQRKKGGVFAPYEHNTQKIIFKATAIDGMGSQGLLIELIDENENQINACHLLLNQMSGIKEVWTVANVSTQSQYHQAIHEELLHLKQVDADYIQKIVNHFVGVMYQAGSPPPLFLLQVQEWLNLSFYPEVIDPLTAIQAIGVNIRPFTRDIVLERLKKTTHWPKTKPMTQSWFEEALEIDTAVNQTCSFKDGVKLCNLKAAYQWTIETWLPMHREKWGFHFLWVALWAKSYSRKNDKFWQDCFFVAYALYEGEPMEAIPIMRHIARFTVVNSLETMESRQAHLV